MIQSISEAKNNFSTIVKTKETIFITKNGKTIKTLLDYELYQQMYQAWKDSQIQKALNQAEESFEENDMPGIGYAEAERRLNNA